MPYPASTSPSTRRLRWLLNHLRPQWKVVTLGILALLLANILGAIIPRLIGRSVDDLQGTFSLQRVLLYAGIIALLTCVMWVIRMTSRLTLFGVGRHVEAQLKQRVFEHLLSLEPAYFAVNPVGDLISRATSDLDNIRRLLGFSVLSLANTIFAYATTLPFMLAVHLRLSLLAIAVYPIMLFLVQSFSERLRVEQAVVQEELSNLSSLIQEDMSGMALIKIYAQEENERRAFRTANQHLYLANLELARTRNTLFPLLTGLASLSLLILLWLGGQEIAQNQITVGELISLLVYVERLVFPTALLGFTITAYQRGEVSIDRIEAIFSAQPEVQDAPGAIALDHHQVRGHLSAKQLNYTYPGAPQPALQDVSFAIEPGETVAIVGPIGSGKSTLVNTLPRLLAINPNQLFLDGIDITRIHLSDLRRAIAFVPQDSYLFSTTLLENIGYGDPTATPQQVENAAKQAQIQEEILTFPQGYETVVGERGITLSGGQRQRTALARALVMDAPILVLDDALSSVDNQTATRILQHLSQGTHRKTVLFISHQLSAAAQADRIFVMDKGRIVQVGRHEALVQQPGLYQSLWNQHQSQQQLEAVL